MQSATLAKPRREMQFPDGSGQRDACPDWRSPCVRCIPRRPGQRDAVCYLAKPRREMQYPDGLGQRNACPDWRSPCVRCIPRRPGQRDACPDWRSPAVKCSSRWGRSAGCSLLLAKPRRGMQFPAGPGRRMQSPSGVSIPALKSPPFPH